MSDSTVPLNGVPHMRTLSFLLLACDFGEKPMKLGYNHQRGQNLKVARRSKRGLKEKNESPKKKRKVQCGEESPKKLKASREGRTMTCGSCGITASISLIQQSSSSLNARSFPRPSVDTRAVLICNDDVEVDKKSLSSWMEQLSEPGQVQYDQDGVGCEGLESGGCSFSSEYVSREQDYSFSMGLSSFSSFLPADNNNVPPTSGFGGFYFDGEQPESTLPSMLSFTFFSPSPATTQNNNTHETDEKLQGVSKSPVKITARVEEIQCCSLILKSLTLQSSRSIGADLTSGENMENHLHITTDAQSSSSLNARSFPRPSVDTRAVLICNDDVEVDKKSLSSWMEQLSEPGQVQYDQDGVGCEGLESGGCSFSSESSFSSFLPADNNNVPPTSGFGGFYFDGEQPESTLPSMLSFTFFSPSPATTQNNNTHETDEKLQGVSKSPVKITARVEEIQCCSLILKSLTLQSS
ncbi:LOW QUALITY PROTEIN: hypothetical protein HID58_018352, partial [Brassica napus]